MLAENTADGEPDLQAIWDLLLAGREFRAEEAEVLADLLGHSTPPAAGWKEGLLSLSEPCCNLPNHPWQHTLRHVQCLQKNVDQPCHGSINILQLPTLS